MTTGLACIVCSSPLVRTFFSFPHAPISSNRLCSSRISAMNEPNASVTLGVCLDCGHIYNVEHDSSLVDYSPGYENSLISSELYREYSQELIDYFFERYELRRRRIVEIGCGRGEFLKALCERGDSFGIGFDPSFTHESGLADLPDRIVIRAEEFGHGDADLNPDFICSRHTLEHIPDPRYFLKAVRIATHRIGIPVFFEVPNALYSLRDGGIWDIIYEHCSYFSSNSLARLFRETGYEPIEIKETFGGQFLTIEARTITNLDRPGSYDCDSEILRLTESFADTYQRKINDWRERLDTIGSTGRRVIVWGAGSKATTFLNILRPTNITYVIDINPRKHGKYVTGAGQEIVSPEFVREYRPDDIICMNPNYVQEITCQARSLGFIGNVMCA